MGTKSPFFVCQICDVLVTKTIWQGKVGVPKLCASNVVVPVTSVHVSSIYCMCILLVSVQQKVVLFNGIQ